VGENTLTALKEKRCQASEHANEGRARHLQASYCEFSSIARVSMDWIVEALSQWLCCIHAVTRGAVVEWPLLAPVVAGVCCDGEDDGGSSRPGRDRCGAGRVVGPSTETRCRTNMALITTMRIDL